MQDHSNEFDLHENGYAGEIYFRMNGFARRPILTPRQKAVCVLIASFVCLIQMPRFQVLKQDDI